ncbi:MAG: UbiA family prenyltransferase [Chitinivibrionales bacterium]|nr:UbiA family prenyltransferase [Chitinivibrionales bacterium]
MKQEDVLVVDLDGTLIHSDVLWESLILLVKKNPLSIFWVVWWYIHQGLSQVKVRIASIVQPDVTLLPFNLPLIEFLKERKNNGTQLWLASASDSRIVEKVADHVGIFTRFFGTTPDCNLRGQKKLDTIKRQLEGKSFSYIGNEKADVPLLNSGMNAYIVAKDQSLAKYLSQESSEIRFFLVQKKYLSFIKALRVHQWSKNILIFVPLFLAHKITNIEKVVSCVTAFLSFCCCASAVYIINDLLDIESDRKHPVKKNRPFASGALPISSGFRMIVVCCILSASISIFFLDINYLLLLGLYFTMTLCYSLFLKRMLLFDVLTLSALYSMRIFAGRVAGSVEVTAWFLAFSSFFFLSLAFIKRFIELKDTILEPSAKLVSRDYANSEMNLIQSAGISSGFMSILVFLLYITTSEQVTDLYNNPKLLWFIGPFLVYWILRMWFLAHRGKVNCDPVSFAIKDRVSWIVGFCIMLLIIFSSSMRTIFEP